MSNSVNSEKLSAGGVTLDEFKHWLNDRRMFDVSMVFHEIVDKFAALQAAPAPEPVQPSELDGWIPFSEKEPPRSAALDNPNITVTDTVLVTNNINARNRMGRMSHKWLAIPLKNSDGSWTAFDDADRCISDLTHWKYA